MQRQLEKPAVDAAEFLELAVERFVRAPNPVPPRRDDEPADGEDDDQRYQPVLHGEGEDRSRSRWLEEKADAEQ